MVILSIRRDGHLDRHEVFHHETIQIGRADSNDLILDDFRIDAHHATLIVLDGTFAIEAAHTSTSFNRYSARNRNRPPMPLVIEGSRLRIKPFAIDLLTHADPLEIQLLSATSRGDDAMRAVYADWLEEQAFPARAELLRTQLAILTHVHDTPEFDALAERLYALTARVPHGWAAYVARPAIDIGDRALMFRAGFAPNARRIAGEDRAVVQLWCGGVRLTSIDDVAYAPHLVDGIERDLSLAIHDLPNPALSPAENHRKCRVFARHADQQVHVDRFLRMSWGRTTDGFVCLAFRDRDDVVLTFGAREGTDIVTTRLPASAFEDRLRRLAAALGA